jgi:hypothetical protein
MPRTWNGAAPAVRPLPRALGRRRGWDTHAEFLGVLTLHGREQVRRNPWCPFLLAFDNLGIRFEILQQMGLHLQLHCLRRTPEEPAAESVGGYAQHLVQPLEAGRTL